MRIYIRVWKWLIQREPLGVINQVLPYHKLQCVRMCSCTWVCMQKHATCPWSNSVSLLNPKNTSLVLTVQKYWSDQVRFPRQVKIICLSVSLTCTMAQTHFPTNRYTPNERGFTGSDHALACLDIRNSKVVYLSQGWLPKVQPIHEV